MRQASVDDALRTAVVAALILASAAPARSDPGYVLISAPARRIRAELTSQVNAPRLAASEWVLAAAQPPELPGQSIGRAVLIPDGKPSRELGLERRPILFARVPADRPDRRQGISVRVEYEATLRSRHLERRRPGEAVPRPPALDLATRRVALAHDREFDWNSEVFQHWLDEHHLRRSAKEEEIDFARRAFLTLKRRFTYEFADRMDRHASKVCHLNRSDCGGMAIVFASVLRANDIPARILVGRWALSAEEKKGNQPRDDRQHVKAEFHATGVGWVPVDLSTAVLFDKSPAGLACFGHDEGDFLTMHLDTFLIVDTVHFGREPVEFLQGICHWAAGAGSFDGSLARETWHVRRLAERGDPE